MVPASADYAALGAARQAAWALGVAEGRLGADAPPVWETGPHETFEADEEQALGQAVRQQYAAVRESVYPGALGLAAGTAGAAAAGDTAAWGAGARAARVGGPGAAGGAGSAAELSEPPARQAGSPQRRGKGVSSGAPGVKPTVGLGVQVPAS